MQVLLRWVGYVLVGVVAAALLFLGTTWVISNVRQNRVYEIEVVAPAVPTDASSIAEGERLVTTRFCTSCHGADLGGDVMANDLVLGRLWATNLTTGEGGIGSTYNDEDLARAIWYGVRPDGTPIFFMPSSEYHQSIDEEHMALMLAYIRSLPPIDREIPTPRLGPLAWVGHVVGFFPLAHAELYDLSEPPIAPVDVAATAEYGATIGVLCTGCHGADLAGMDDPGPGAAPNITPHTSGLADWSYEDFETAMRTGVLPDGSAMSDDMPWRAVARTTDVELQALWAYLNSVEPLPSAIRE